MAADASENRRISISFPQKLVQEPIIYNVGSRFNVITTIISASVNNESACMVIELSGDADEIEKACEYLRNTGAEIKQV